MKKILLAYDGSHYAESALGDLPRMGLAPDVSISVLVVVPESAAEDVLQVAQKQSDHATRVIQSLLPQATIEPYIVAGHSAEVILHEAKDQQVDLIVIGAHGKSALERFFFGSVSAKVAAEAHCSVRVCRSHRQPGFQHLRLTLALDGSVGSQAAVASVLSRPWPQGTGFQVVTVAEPQTKNPDFTLEEMVLGVSDQLRAAGYLSHPTVLTGDAAKAIVKHSESWAPHCIILGSRGLEHGETRKLGTLASAMVTQAECQVEVVR